MLLTVKLRFENMMVLCLTEPVTKLWKTIYFSQKEVKTYFSRINITVGILKFKKCFPMDCWPLFTSDLHFITVKFAFILSLLNWHSCLYDSLPGIKGNLERFCHIADIQNILILKVYFLASAHVTEWPEYSAAICAFLIHIKYWHVKYSNDACKGW